MGASWGVSGASWRRCDALPKSMKTTSFIVFLGTQAQKKTFEARLRNVWWASWAVLGSPWGCRGRLGNERIVHFTTLAHDFRTTSCHVIFMTKITKRGATFDQHDAQPEKGMLSTTDGQWLAVQLLRSEFDP